MKTLYILPESNGESNTVQDILTRAGITYIEVESLHEIWPYLTENVDIVARLPINALTVLVRHMSTLLGEEPVRVDTAPGSRYSHEFNLITSNLNSEVWDTLEGKFAKSGLLAHSPTEVEERSPLTPQGHKTESSAKQIRARARSAVGTKNSNEMAPTSHVQLEELDEDKSVDELTE